MLAAGQQHSVATTSSKADIRADSNRDGKVDIESSTDIAGKHNWSDTAGALFLSNIGDTDRRCSQMTKLPSFIHDPHQGDVLADVMAACHDAVDDVQRAPHLMAPIRTVPIRGLSPSAVGTISVSDHLARKLVRIFRPRGDDDDTWDIVTNETTFSSKHLTRGLQLGIDARTTRGFSGYMRLSNGKVKIRDEPPWDGRATVHFTVTDEGNTWSDFVMLRVAPVLSHHHLQKIDTVMTGKPLVSNSSYSRQRYKERMAMVSGLQQSMKNAGLESPLHIFQHSDAYWPQDFFEPGYQSMPGPNGTIGLRIVMFPQYHVRQTPYLMRELRAAGVGAVRDPSHPGVTKAPANHMINLDAGGNLETIPPYEHKGKKYPNGRIIMGGVDEQGKFPYMLSYLRAQEAQDPLLVDSLWLDVQHLDEFLQFVPANTTRGWRLAYADTESPVTALRKAQAKGFGSVWLEREPKRKDPENADRRHTIDDFLRSEAYLEANKESARRIRKAVELVVEETGLTEDETFGVPVLYRRRFRRRYEIPGFKAGRKRPGANATESPQRRNEARDRGMVSIFPSAINGIVLTASHYVAPKQYGPLVDGKDIMEEMARGVYARMGFDVDFIEDMYFARHQGDVHCATNTFRDMRGRWWQ
ncbi:hypothetical protein L249_7989 [Ophiocordyceps polyrhachis-furcata BCC 54312]|uniref:Protein-arginine deiminase C-terminal domain-containing protein n=1 Tax=Ophiocordyceps polyrhachis-furcata BCC 54312 TaxID=1330021 RepID=A0A367LH80_9HYPO|nr:hypothetical protein L249_7989 [Ophiocordyceps polyrhachis-furcata BCC 54312]